MEISETTERTVMQASEPNSRRFMLGGVMVSLLASSCCVGPFLLLATGVSGAWMSRLMVLQAYQPLFVSLVLTFFAMAWVKIFKPFSSSKATEVSGHNVAVRPTVMTRQKAAFFLSFGLALILLLSEYWIVWLA